MKRLCHICGQACRTGDDLIQGIAVRIGGKGELIPSENPEDDLMFHRACLGAQDSPQQTKPTARSGATIEHADILGFLNEDEGGTHV